MLSGPHALRWLALVTIGALTVHRLRYAYGYGDGSADALARHGHGYMWMVLTGSTIALCAAAAGVAVALRRAARDEGRPEAPAPTFASLWVRSAAALAGLYVLQESLEGILAPAHPGGLAGVLGTGGWTAFLLAAAIGFAVAWLVRGTGEMVARVARRSSHSPRFGAARPLAVRPLLTPSPRLSPLARRIAGRAPPARSR